jgi:hypothetical protein
MELRRFQTRFGPFTDASSSWMKLASVDATDARRVTHRQGY